VTEPNDLSEVSLSVSKHILYMSRHVKLSHISHGEVPVFFIISCVVNMLIGVGCASIIGSPNVIAEIHQFQGDVQSVIIEEPSASVVHKPVLHDNRLSDNVTKHF